MRFTTVGRHRQDRGRFLPVRRPRIESLEDRACSRPVGLDPSAVDARATPTVLTPGSPSDHAVGLTPPQLRAAYGFDDVGFARRRSSGDGTGQTIAIVVAYQQPNIKADLAAFDRQFGLPDPPSFTGLHRARRTAGRPDGQLGDRDVARRRVGPRAGPRRQHPAGRGRTPPASRPVPVVDYAARSRASRWSR